MLIGDGPYCPWIHTADDRPRGHPWTIPQRRLTHYLLVTSLDGEEHLRVADQDVAVAAGDTYLIQPGVLADIGSRAGNTPVWIHFDLAFDPRRAGHPQVGPYAAALGERARWLQPDARAVFGLDLPTLVPKPLRPLFRVGVRDVVRTWRIGHAVAHLQAGHQLAGLLLAWVAHAWRDGDAQAALSPEARVGRAETLARQHLASGFDVDDFAAAAGYSRSRFCAVWQRVRGGSPGTWLRRERMLLAETLLARADLPIGKVGAMVGYPDATVFGRVFRGHAGMSPGEWRRRAS